MGTPHLALACVMGSRTRTGEVLTSLLLWCWEWICSQGCSLTGRQGKSGILTKLQEKNNILIFCHRAKMAPVLWDNQAKLNICCGDSTDGMRMTTSVSHPRPAAESTGRNGYFQGCDLPYSKVIQTHITWIMFQISPGFSAEPVSSFCFPDTKKKCNIYYKSLL